MLDRLHVYHSKRSQGTGTRYVIAEHVRDAAGFQAIRTADAVAMDTWTSSGLLLHGFEVKVSRSDWLAELADPGKCLPVKRFCDYWWLVTSERDLVKPGELPNGWGLLVASDIKREVYDFETSAYRWITRATLRQVHQARRIISPDPVGKSFLASLLRATAKTASRGAVPLGG